MAAESNKILARDALLRRLDRLREKGRRIVFTNGCFDILHVGHVRYLRSARALGDALVVGLNSDASVRRLKGAGRPVNSLEDRAEILAAFPFVTYVVAFEVTSFLLLAAIVGAVVLAKRRLS